jgi:hypothetical protein
MLTNGLHIRLAQPVDINPADAVAVFEIKAVFYVTAFVFAEIFGIIIVNKNPYLAGFFPNGYEGWVNA